MKKQSDQPDLIPVVPRTDDDFERYFDLRWRVLRAAWKQPRGSERDDRENDSMHLMIRDENGDALAVGRLHLNSPFEAQVRYMAVDPAAQNRGLGSVLLRALEQLARNAGAKSIVLNAREPALRFYQKNGYQIEGPGPTLYDSISHLVMRKELSHSVSGNPAA